MTFTIEPDIFDNDDVTITTDSDGDLSIEHPPTGRTLKLDEALTVGELLGDVDGLQDRTSGLSEDGSEADFDVVDTEVLNNKYQVRPDGEVAEIQAKADAVESDGGGLIELQPNGVYDLQDVTNDLRLPGKCILDGNGATIQGTGNGGELLDNRGDDIVLRNMDWSTHDDTIVVRNLHIDGGFSTGERSGFGALVQFVNASNVYVENITANYGYRHNFQFTNVQNSRVVDSTFDYAMGDDCVSISDGGFEYGGTQGASNSRLIWIDGCSADHAGAEDGFTGDGIEVDDGPWYVHINDFEATNPSGLGATVKQHNNEASPRHVYFNGGDFDSIRAVNDGSPVDADVPVGEVHFNDITVRHKMRIGTESVYAKGGEVGEQVYTFTTQGYSPSGSIKDVTFPNTDNTGEVILIEAGDFTVQNNDFWKDGSTGSRFMSVEPDGVDATVVAENNKADCNGDGVSAVAVAPKNGGTLAGGAFRNNHIIGANTGIGFQGTASDYSGRTYCVGNTMDDLAFNILNFGESAIRQHVITLWNYGNSANAANPNASPVQPANPTVGEMYLDDGTNVSGGVPALGYYDGSAWLYSTFDTASA